MPADPKSSGQLDGKIELEINQYQCFTVCSSSGRRALADVSLMWLNTHSRLL